MKTLKRLCIILAVIYIAGCKQDSKSTTTGNPFVSFSMAGSSSATNVAKKLWEGLMGLFIPTALALPPPGMMSDSAGNAVTVDLLWATVGEIEFKLDEVNGGLEVDGSDIEFQGPYSVDMLTASPSPLQAGRISTSAMRRVKIKLIRTLSQPSGGPSELVNNSLYIEGSVNGFAFSYSTQDETVIEIAGPNLVTATENSSLLLELKTANLIKKINLSGISSPTAINDSNRVPSANPCPSIEPSANDLFTCFKKGIETESNLGRDDNGDHQIGTDEDSVND